MFCKNGWPATLLKKRFWYRCFSVNFAKFVRTLLVAEHLRWLLPAFPDYGIEQNRNYRNYNFYIFDFSLLSSSFFFSDFIFHKEALCFIIFVLWLCSNMLNLEKHTWIHKSKIKKNMLILKFHPRMKGLRVFFSFFHPWMKFHLDKNV